MKIYIAGPMGGLPEFNYPEFNRAAAMYREMGFTVFNPAENDNECQPIAFDAGLEGGDIKTAIKEGFDFRKAFTWDVTKVIEADCIYMLRGWELSTGAKAEHAVATAIKAKHPEYEIYYQQ